MQTPFASAHVQEYLKDHKFQQDFRQVAQLDTVGLFAGAVDTCFDKAGSVYRPGECMIWVFPKIGVPPNHPF